ncbi:hypothetical protein [Mesobacillus jeotgali]|uniref:hypothetical protein n=1 Tax=Mesobacillus jeotgali TaxID=129985 RepID=UPI0009A59AC9|nr:hypothetical protein [Mesobacillus jeotgali]
MKKNTMKSISYIYNILVFGSFFIWGFSVQSEEGLVYPAEHKFLLTIFLILMFIGMVLAGVNLSSVKEKGDAITRKTWITGIIMAFIFIIFKVVSSVK